MLCLATSNPRKYAPLGELLARLQIELRSPDCELPEVQDEDFLVVLAAKARAAAAALGQPCLVDDAGLLLDAYPGFPGPMTRSVCKLLGAEGFQRLLAGVSPRGRMMCHLGCWVDGAKRVKGEKSLDGELWHWQGEISGRLSPSPASNPSLSPAPGPLTQWFIPDEPGENAVYGHRSRALEALERDIVQLRAALGNSAAGLPPAAPAMPDACAAGCVFCQEFAGHASSIYHELLGRELPCRVVRQTPHFLAFPPLGEFVEGGLLLTSRAHVISMAHLAPEQYDDLEQLMAETSDVLLERYGCRPVMFEHSPVAPGEKGTCCVDHAHLNVFPVRVDVHAQLQRFPHVAIRHMRELAEPKLQDQAYLFLQDNDGARWVYDTGIVPTQYIRKIITAALGMPDRWHWREYLGLEELKRTYCALSGWRSRHAPIA